MIFLNLIVNSIHTGKACMFSQAHFQFFFKVREKQNIYEVFFSLYHFLLRKPII